MIILYNFKNKPLFGKRISKSGNLHNRRFNLNIKKFYIRISIYTFKLKCKCKLYKSIYNCLLNEN